MVSKKKKKKIKDTVRKLKERMKERKKTKGDPKIKGVNKPHTKQTYIQKLKAKKKTKKDGKGPKRHVMIGPKGGVYAQSDSGKKDYGAKKKTPKGVDRGATVKQRLANQKQKRIKKALTELISDSDKIKDFIATFKEGKTDET